MRDTDVIVIGAGNAALCAALSAADQGASVVVLERAHEEDRGGNSRFTAGAMRVVYNGLDDLLELMPDLTEEDRKNDFGQYTSDQFFDDMGRITDYRADPDLVETLVHGSYPALKWLQGKGVRFMPMYARQAFETEDGRFRFWGGLTVEAWGGGEGLVESLHKAVAKSNIDVRYGARALSLLQDDAGIHGVRMKQLGVTQDLRAGAVVIASGGFQANTEMRTRYLGPGWDLAKVRGSRFNTGDGITMALNAGAMPFGNWSGCHSVGWDRNAPPFGDLAVGDGFQKHSYPFGIIVNANGERFVDEGADFRNYTYAKYGGEVLKQPGQFAWQVFDAKSESLLRDEYRIREITKAESDTLEGLADQLSGVDKAGFLKTVADYNDAVDQDTAFDPTIKDGRATTGLDLPKSNWANPLDTPPFKAFAITCGITFTFGGLKVSTHGEVIDTEEKVIRGLFAAGELVGGLFYGNYPGGSGLTSGAVFGRAAGTSAGRLATGVGA